MAARKTLGWALALGMALLTLEAYPSVARADEGTARLHDGGVVSGTIEVYEPGRRVVLRTASGEVVTLAYEQIAELHITPSPRPGATATTSPPPPPPPSTYAVPAPASPTDPRVQQVYVVQTNQPYPPYQPSLQLPSLAAPILMMLLGGALMGTGLAYTSDLGPCGDRYDDDCDRAGRVRLGLMTSGAPLAVVGLLVVLPIQLGKRSRRREGYSRRFALRPSVDLAGGRYGVAGTLSF